MGKGDLKQSVTVDLEGNLPQRSKAYEKALERMGKRGEQHLSGMARMSQIAGRGLDKLGNRYTGLISGATVALAVKQVGDLSERYTRLGISAGISADKIDALKQQVFDVAQAPDIRVDPGEMISAIEDIVEKTGDLKFAQDNIRNIGLAIQATGATGADVGALLAEFQKQGITAPGEVLKTMDAMNEQGKEGAFTLKDLASLGPRVVSAYNAAGRQGTQAMKEMGAALQVIRMGTGSSEQAATAFEATLRTLADPKKIEQLKQLGGIEVFDPEQLKKGRQQLKPINELMVEIVKAAGGKQTNLGRVFDAEAMRAFNTAAAEFQRTGSVDSLQKFMQVNGDGSTTINDSARAAREFNSVMTSLRSSWTKFADANLKDPLQEVADIIGFLGDETAQTTLETAKWGAAVLGVAIGARKLYGITKGGLFGTKGGAAGALGSAASSMKPIPVFVVNGGGLPGMGGMGGKGARTFGKLKTTAGLLAGSNMKTLGAMGAGAMGTAAAGVGAAGLAGYGIGTLINDNLVQGTAFGDAIGYSLNRVLAAFGNEESKRAIAINEREQRIKNEIHLKIDSPAQVRVQGMSAGGGTDIDVDAGPTMGAL